MEHNTNPHELVEKFITDKFLNTCVAATNGHGEDNKDFTRFYPGSIPEDKSGRTSKSVPCDIMAFIAFRIQTYKVGMDG